ncbi:Glycogen synthase [anaerobic digester metagenome]
MADILLPNSKMEENLIINKFNLSNSNFKVVYNAVDKNFFEANPENFINKYGDEEFLLCSGRIEPRKNIHSLIKAVNDTDLKLFIVGKYDEKDGYFSYCKKLSNDNIQFLGFFNQEELSSAYAAAKVHVLPSFYETPGLSSLEAAAAGCNVVSTEVGSAIEYFGDMAYYCSPNNVDSIKKALFEAWSEKFNHEVKKTVKKYSWEATASQTLNAYELIV